VYFRKTVNIWNARFMTLLAEIVGKLHVIYEMYFKNNDKNFLTCTPTIGFGSSTLSGRITDGPPAPAR
jgi:hypothetical protein